MTNFEIKEEVNKYDTLLKEAANLSSFELNPQIIEYKRNIALLRKMCSHSYENGQIALNNEGHCIYCGKRIKE